MVGDAAVRAGGVWGGLKTGGVGLAVAMRGALVLAWVECRMEGERVAAEGFVLTVVSPVGRVETAVSETDMVPARG